MKCSTKSTKTTTHKEKTGVEREMENRKLNQKALIGRFWRGQVFCLVGGLHWTTCLQQATWLGSVQLRYLNRWIDWSIGTSLMMHAANQSIDGRVVITGTVSTVWTLFRCVSEWTKDTSICVVTLLPYNFTVAVHSTQLPVWRKCDLVAVEKNTVFQPGKTNSYFYCFHFIFVFNILFELFHCGVFVLLVFITLLFILYSVFVFQFFFVELSLVASTKLLLSYKARDAVWVIGVQRAPPVCVQLKEVIVNFLHKTARLGTLRSVYGATDQTTSSGPASGSI